jgi:hypothetical protein
MPLWMMPYHLVLGFSQASCIMILCLEFSHEVLLCEILSSSIHITLPTYRIPSTTLRPL